MKYLELKAHINQKKLAACYVASGDDAYLIKKTEEMFAAQVEFKELNISILPDSATTDEISAALNSLPFMSDYRLIVMDGKHYPALKDYLKNPSPTSVVLVKSANTLKVFDNTQTIDCNRLSVYDLSRSIALECEKNSAAISKGGAELLADYCGRYMGRIKSELYKLIDAADEKEISVSLVKEMVNPELEYKVFELSAAVVDKDASKALSLLDDMLSEGYGAAAKVYGLLYAHFKRLFAASLSPNDPSLAEYLDVKEFAAVSAVRQSKSFTKLKLKRITDKLHKLDYDIKTGKINDKTGLQTFIMEAVSEVN